ncbi:hypothetical protein E2C01_013318 [Portunus trituberculatus]|uniref:Uncharacterized protein n=1 Tax=Portunus trituberculatus TaxID=210409 RepID=A0A5B7DGY7_PORTR|nr:hypothetical protein [Portunus trituberculatus]
MTFSLSPIPEKDATRSVLSAKKCVMTSLQATDQPALPRPAQPSPAEPSPAQPHPARPFSSRCLTPLRPVSHTRSLDINSWL